MKYVRTSHGEIVDLSYCPQETINDPLASKDLSIYLKSYGYGEIVKEADSIEKLCDYCIYLNCEDELIIRKLPLSTSWKSVVRSMKNGLIRDIKLAILTDKVLSMSRK